MSIQLHHETGEVRVEVDPMQAVAAALAAMHAASGHPRPVEEYVFDYVDETGERRVLGAEGGTLGDAGIDGCNERVEMRLQRKYEARAQLAACGEAVYEWVEVGGDDGDSAAREQGVTSAVRRALEEGRSGRERLQLLAVAEVPRPGFVAWVVGRALAQQLARMGLGEGTAELLECCKEMGGENGAMGAALLHAAGGLSGDDITAMSRAELVGALVSEGASLDVQDDDNNTALIRACCKGHAEVAKLLIHKGAALDVQNQYNDTALIGACARGLAEVAELLIDKGAALDVQGSSNETALSRALEQGLYDLAEMMMRKGAVFEDVQLGQGSSSEMKQRALHELMRFNVRQREWTARFHELMPEVLACFKDPVYYTRCLAVATVQMALEQMPTSCVDVLPEVLLALYRAIDDEQPEVNSRARDAIFKVTLLPPHVVLPTLVAHIAQVSDRALQVLLANVFPPVIAGAMPLDVSAVETVTDVVLTSIQSDLTDLRKAATWCLVDLYLLTMGRPIVIQICRELSPAKIRLLDFYIQKRGGQSDLATEMAAGGH